MDAYVYNSVEDDVKMAMEIYEITQSEAEEKVKGWYLRGYRVGKEHQPGTIRVTRYSTYSYRTGYFDGVADKRLEHE